MAISIHAPRMGSDYAYWDELSAFMHFNPRSRMGSDQAVKPGHPAIFISIHAPPHGERRENRLRLKPNGYISIHAPRMGSDRASLSVLASPRNFNPRPPHGERRSVLTPWIGEIGFQSTLPAWGATSRITSETTGASHFNPRSPHGERQQKHEISSLFL